MLGQVITVTVLFFITVGSTLEDKEFWRSVAKEELENALKVKWNLGNAENIILFIGDGMGINTITAARIYKGGEQSKLTFDNFPHVGLLKTYAVDKQVPDSAGSATALFSGVKTNYHSVGIQATVKNKDCKASLDKKNHLDNFILWAQNAGKKTGIVTTTRVTHATPAAAYAYSPERNWECEANIPKNEACKDIGRQLIEDDPGKNFNIIMGGGRQTLVSNSTAADKDPIDRWACYRVDGRNLIEDWKKEKQNRGVGYDVVMNTAELESLDKNKEYVLGIFSNSHLNMDYIRDKSPSGMPSLQQMTAAALKVLNNGENGFVLMVEGGLIDFAHHRGHARKALDETLAFDLAINWTMNWLSENNILEKTLVIVTADHDHGLIINGNPDRANNILGVAQKSPMDGEPYTTLTYGTGGPNNYQYTAKDGKVVRTNPESTDTTDYDYSVQAPVLTDEVKHGGSDVVVYAKGPMAHLFHSVHEQNYVAYVMAYAAKIGPYKSGSSSVHISTLFVEIFITLSLINHQKLWLLL
ncbi:alkaline phosphatase-like [Lycorma delicatula]|uniref:alkaline phosphatase-like n=1 Tax=Lycorma delicatula TaxID=130591 RepID=UPI003F50D660